MTNDADPGGFNAWLRPCGVGLGDVITKKYTETQMGLFGLPYIRLVRLLFSAETIFFSHNNSVKIVFFSQFS